MTNEEAIKDLKEALEETDTFRRIYHRQKEVCIPYEKRYKALDLAIKALEQLKVGTWEYVQYDGNPNIGNWHCSKCRGICIGMHSLEDAYDYCPNCGAKMEVEE